MFLHSSNLSPPNILTLAILYYLLIYRAPPLLIVSFFDRVAGHSWAVKKFFNVDVYRVDGKQD